MCESRLLAIGETDVSRLSALVTSSNKLIDADNLERGNFPGFRCRTLQEAAVPVLERRPDDLSDMDGKVIRPAGGLRGRELREAKAGEGDRRSVRLHLKRGAGRRQLLK
jgi:hypothetical protein